MHCTHTYGLCGIDGMVLFLLSFSSSIINFNVCFIALLHIFDIIASVAVSRGIPGWLLFIVDSESVFVIKIYIWEKENTHETDHATFSVLIYHFWPRISSSCVHIRDLWMNLWLMYWKTQVKIFIWSGTLATRSSFYSVHRMFSEFEVIAAASRRRFLRQ